MKRLAAWVCFVLALGIVIVAIAMAASLVSEYGPAEGYGNLTLQTLPIVGVGVLLAGALVWVGRRLMRRGPG